MNEGERQLAEQLRDQLWEDVNAFHDAYLEEMSVNCRQKSMTLVLFSPAAVNDRQRDIKIIIVCRDVTGVALENVSDRDNAAMADYIFPITTVVDDFDMDESGRFVLSGMYGWKVSWRAKAVESSHK